MPKLPNLIFECANFHGGNYNLIEQAINDFSEVDYLNKHIKFQPFKSDTLSLPDFSHFSLYQKLFISSEVWKNLIETSLEKIGHVWIDIIDVYAIEILKENLGIIHGIKLQASAIENIELYNQLKELNLSKVELIINISGYHTDIIEKIVENFNNLNVKKIILQAGFQSYPTDIQDCALNKIQILKTFFSDHEICFADHLDANDHFAQILPSLACVMGASYIEKHICIQRDTTKYDSFSALEKYEMTNLVDILKKTNLSLGNCFINHAETKYLEDSIQKPILVHSLKAGQFISDTDLIYRRTNQDGIKMHEIKALQTKGYVLTKDKTEFQTVQKSDFKKARIGVIVACRLKSTRLPQKALLDIEGYSLIQHSLKNCSTFPADVVVLASSDHPQDQLLRNEAEKLDIPFVAGDADNVVKRYLDVCEEFDLDIVFRMTGDNPIPSADIADYLLQSHFKTGADYTYPENVTIGLTTEVYNVHTLQRIQGHISEHGHCEYTEYMNWYATNNSDIFKVNKVILPKHLFFPNYRMTVDYPEDYEFMKSLLYKLKECNLQPTISNIQSIIRDNPEILHINSNMNVVYYSDRKLIEKLKQVTKIKALKGYA